MTPDQLTIYISGPMTGLPEFNFPEFERVAQMLRAKGLKVVSPHEVAHDDGGTAGSLSKEEYLRGDLIAMLQECNSIVLLKGWENSWGANLEVHVAKQLAFHIFFIDESEGILVLANI